MKLKKLYILSAAIVATMSLSSCDDFLTVDERGTENLDTYFKTEDEVNAYVGGCYFEIAKGGGWWQVYNPWLMFDMTTDDLWDGNTAQDDGYQITTHFMPTGETQGILQNFWGARYQGINTCNVALERIPGAAMDDDMKELRMAEVRFLRAFFYFDLVRNFGGVPLMLTYGQEAVGRSSQEECYKFIEDELTAAAEILPQRSEWASQDMGRATRGAALGILGKAQLYQGKWDEAKATLKTIIDEQEYELLPNFGDVWSVHFNNSKESLFETQQMYNGDLYATGGSLTVVTGMRGVASWLGDGWCWGQPTSDLENAFIAAGDTERLRWTIIKTMSSSIAGETRFSEYVAGNREICSVTDQKYLDYKKQFGWTDYDYISKFFIDPALHKSARIIRKYYVPLADRPEVYNIDKIPLNHRILRYADVLLMYAEACVECSAPDNAQAQWALNKVRTRVNLPAVTSTGTQLRDAIRAERRLELAHEQCRLYDLRRWDDANGKKMMCNIFGPNGSFVKYNTGPNADMYESWNQIEPSDKGVRFKEDRDLLYPIPLYEIQHSNGLITQNPGWN